MTARDKATIRASEIRQRLAELAGNDELNDEQRAEIGTLRTEYADVELRIQAATVADDAPVVDPPVDVDPPDSEELELRSLRDKVEFSTYLVASKERRGVTDGPEAELNQHLDVPSDRLPLEVLAPTVEQRAAVDGDSQANQGSWVTRLFADTAALKLGVEMPAVPPGLATFPVLTSTAAPSQRGRTQAAATSTVTASVTEIKPVRAAISATYSVEDDLRLPGLVDAIRSDLAGAMTERVDRSIFLGDDSANENVADIVGLTTAGITELTISQTNKVKAAETLAVFAGLVDGVYAGSMGDLRVVSSVGANTLWSSTTPISNHPSTLGEILRRNNVNWQVRGEIATGSDAAAFGGFIGLQRGISGAAVAPVWSSANLVVDPYNTTGEVSLTLNFFWGFAIPRVANFRRLKFVT